MLPAVLFGVFLGKSRVSVFKVAEACEKRGDYVEISECVGFIARAERDGTRAETRFRLSPKRTSPFKSVGASGQSTAGSRGVRISFSNAGYTTFGGGVRVLATHSIRQFPLHFPSRASPCASRFRTSSTTRDITYSSNNPLHKPVATFEKSL